MVQKHEEIAATKGRILGAACNVALQASIEIMAVPWKVLQEKVPHLAIEEKTLHVVLPAGKGKEDLESLQVKTKISKPSIILLVDWLQPITS